MTKRRIIQQVANTSLLAAILSFGTTAHGATISVGSVELNQPGDDYIGHGSDGSLTVNGGTVVDQSESNTYVGFQGSNGELTITDPGSTYIVGGDGGNWLSLGGTFWQPGGNGTVNVQNGGELQVHSSDSSDFSGARIDLADGTNQLNVESGGTVTMTNFFGAHKHEAVLHVGRSDGSGTSDSTMTVDGAGSSVNILTEGTYAALNVATTGLDGIGLGPARGTVSVTNGASINIQALTDASQTAAIVNVARGELTTGRLAIDGPGSALNLTGNEAWLYAGFYYDDTAQGGDALVTISDGADVNVAADRINRAAFGWIGSGDLTMNDGTLIIGPGASGVGANVSNELYVGSGIDGVSTVRLDNGSLVQVGSVDAAQATSWISIGGQGGIGSVSLDGASSLLLNSHETRTSYLGVGIDGTGSLSIANGSTVSNSNGISRFGSVSGEPSSALLTVTGNSGFDAGRLFDIGAGGIGVVGIGDEDNSYLRADEIAVHAGGYLGGTGTLIGNTSVAAGGILAAGNSPGEMTIDGNLSFDPGAIWEFEIGGSSIDDFDRFTINGDLIFLGDMTIIFSFIDDFMPTIEDLFPILTVSGLVQGFDQFVTFDYVGLGGGYDFNTAFVDGRLISQATAVPEPSTLLLFAAGLLALLSRRFGR